MQKLVFHCSSFTANKHALKKIFSVYAYEVGAKQSLQNIPLLTGTSRSETERSTSRASTQNNITTDTTR